MTDSPLKVVATQLGFLVLAWSHIEDVADDLFTTLMLWNEPKEEIYQIVLHQLDFRDKLALTKTLAYTRDPDSEWHGRVETLVNRIDNELRVERNQLVHAMWNTTPEGGVERQKRSRPVVAYKQARHRHLSLPKPEIIPVERITDTTQKILKATDELAELLDIFIDGAGALQIQFA